MDTTTYLDGLTRCDHCNGMGREVYTRPSGGLSTQTCTRCDGLGRK